MTISPVTQNTFSSAISLLKKNHLPTEDITGASPLFILTDANELIGTVGLELCGNYALLRSLCVDGTRRNSGAGERLLSFAETFAKNKGVRELYLLTTTADK
ncbi:MAG: GNAT family N-acetyltransferase, partial [Chitinophagaceae bacterium]